MGPTGPSARRAPYFFFFLAAFFFFAIVSPPSRTARPAVGSIFRDSTGWPEEVSRGKYTMRGVRRPRTLHLGPSGRREEVSPARRPTRACDALGGGPILDSAP